MQLREAKQTLKQLVNGVHPVTGTPLADDSPCQHVQIMRAIHTVLGKLEEVDGHAREVDKPVRAGERWSNEEDDRLKRAYQREETIPNLANSHRRTEGAIRSRLEKLGLLEKKYYDDEIDYSEDRSSGSRINRDLDRWSGGGSGDPDDWSDTIDFLLD